MTDVGERARERQFKVLDGITVPWSFVEPHRAQAGHNHGQSLERLNARGGLGWSELLAVVTDRNWFDLTKVEIAGAETAVRALLEQTSRETKEN